MDLAPYEPWIGQDYDRARLLVVSESAYSWREKDGVLLHPEPGHPSGSVDWAIDRGDDDVAQFFRRVTRALAGVEAPTREQREAAWNGCAYTIYVPGSVGEGARTRPSEEQWQAASEPFLRLLHELAPRRCVVFGKEAWSRMPETQVYLSDDVQAYRLPGGALCWCLCLTHPAGGGPSWRTMHQGISVFRASEFLDPRAP